MWGVLEKRHILSLNCLGDAGSGETMTPGVTGHIDHVLLRTHQMWAGKQAPAASFKSWCHRAEPRSPRSCGAVSHSDLMRYPEADLLHHVPNAPPRGGIASAAGPRGGITPAGPRGGITLLVGRAIDLLGTPRGEWLRRWALERRIALAWAAGDGQPFDPFDHKAGTAGGYPPYSFRR